MNAGSVTYADKACAWYNPIYEALAESEEAARKVLDSANDFATDANAMTACQVALDAADTTFRRGEECIKPVVSNPELVKLSRLKGFDGEKGWELANIRWVETLLAEMSLYCSHPRVTASENRIQAIREAVEKCRAFLGVANVYRERVRKEMERIAGIPGLPGPSAVTPDAAPKEEDRIALSSAATDLVLAVNAIVAESTRDYPDCSADLPQELTPDAARKRLVRKLGEHSVLRKGNRVYLIRADFERLKREEVDLVTRQVRAVANGRARQPQRRSSGHPSDTF